MGIEEKIKKIIGSIRLTYPEVDYLTKSELTKIEGEIKKDKTPQPDYLVYKYAHLFGKKARWRDEDSFIISPTAKEKIATPNLAVSMFYYSLVNLYLDEKIDLLKEKEAYPNRRILPFIRKKLYIQRKTEFPDSPLNNILEGIFLKKRRLAKIRGKQSEGLVRVDSAIRWLYTTIPPHSEEVSLKVVKYIAEKGSRGTESDADNLKNRIKTFQEKQKNLSSLLIREILRGYYSENYQ